VLVGRWDIGTIGHQGIGHWHILSDLENCPKSSTNRQANFSNRQVGSHRNSKNTRPSNRDETQANRPMFFQNRPIVTWPAVFLSQATQFANSDDL
jgi:hypothetical protein